MISMLRRKEGFTLIEVILIIVITAIAIPVLIYVLGQQARFTVDNEKVVNAALLGQDLVELVRSEGYATADVYNGYADTKTLSSVQYSRSAEVCEVNATDLDGTCSLGTGIKRITVTVTSDLGSTQVVSLLADF